MINEIKSTICSYQHSIMTAEAGEGRDWNKFFVGSFCEDDIA